MDKRIKVGLKFEIQGYNTHEVVYVSDVDETYPILVVYKGKYSDCYDNDWLSESEVLEYLPTPYKVGDRFKSSLFDYEYEIVKIIEDKERPYLIYNVDDFYVDWTSENELKCWRKI